MTSRQFCNLLLYFDLQPHPRFKLLNYTGHHRNSSEPIGGDESVDNEGACEEVGQWQVKGPGSLEGGWQGCGGARQGYGYPLTQCNANTSGLYILVS